MALDPQDDTGVTPMPASSAGPPNPSFATSPNEVHGYTESSSHREDNTVYLPTTWLQDADSPFNLPTTPEKGEPSGWRVRSMSPDSPELAQTMKRPRAHLANLMAYNSSPLAPLNNETTSDKTPVLATFRELVYPPSKGQTLHDAYNTSLHAKLSIVNDIPPSKTTPSLDLGVPFSMQTSLQGPANPFPSSGPLPAFDRCCPQVPWVNADTQRAKPRQTLLSNAFGLSANISASNTWPPGSMAPPPNTWEQSTPWHNVSVGPSSLKISNKQSMSNLSAPQPHQSHSSAAANLKGPVLFPGNLHAPDQRTSSFRQPTPLSELPQLSLSLQAPKASTKSKNLFLQTQPKQKKKGV
ncbi:hypothetical protein B0H34DRAFT_713312 [Crassisporium funariophilum]|nr:hypothetical protein B0H34DRAFT_713312 [Crassisporium funariophilum]